MGTIEIVRAKTDVINLEMNPPEMRKERIERAKQSLMQKIMKDHPADRYDEVVFWVVPPPIDQGYELAQQYRREDGEWYLRGERVSGRDVLNHVQENCVIVEAEAKVRSKVLKLEKPRAEYVGFSNHDADTIYRCSECGKMFGGWSIYHNRKKNGTQNYCPYCEIELEGLG